MLGTCTFSFLCDISPMAVCCYLGWFHFNGFSVLNYAPYFSFSFSLYHVLLYLFSFLSISSLSMLFCCRELSGCAAKPNSLSYNSPHDVSYNSGCAVSSIYSPWICGKDCDVSEVSWSDSLRFLPFYSFFPYEFFLAFGLSLGA